jgi:hypothetical protein
LESQAPLTENTIRVYLEGGLGNQLFGLANGISIANRNQAKLLLDCTNLRARKFELSRYGFECSEQIRSKAFVTSSSFLRQERVIREKDFRFDPRIYAIRTPASIRGYFQTWRYFDEYRKEILDLLGSPKVLSKEYQELLIEMEQNRTLIVHVRRGDYKNLINYHGLVSKNYLQIAIETQIRQTEIEKIWIFTDSPEDIDELGLEFDRVIGPETLNDAVEVLDLMKRATAFVGSNSSLSWWAAYLNDSHDASPIFPSPWFQEESIDTRDLLLPNWFSLQL